MLSLLIKDIRNVLEETLKKFYDFADYSIGSTRVIDNSKEFRIEFRIYDASFWMDIDPAIDSIHIATRSFGEPDHLDSLQIWLSKPYQYDTERFDFGWRSDLECFFDTFHSNLKERVEKTHNPSADKAAEPNIKIGPFKEDQLMKYLEEEEAASYEEYAENPPKKSVLSQILDAMNEETPVAKVDESKVGECKIADKPSIFNSLKDDEDNDEYI